MPRQRTARIPVLSPTVRRPDGSHPRGGKPLKARVVALGLVVLSLALVTVYFRESEDGALHEAQRVAVSVLTPFEVAAERVARPFQDAWGWGADLLSAKEENAKLEEEVEALRQQVVANQTAAQEVENLKELLDFVQGKSFPEDFDPVATRVLVQPQSVFRHEVVVAAGSSDGVRVDDPVVTPQGLAGTVTEVTPNSAKVRLLTDQQSAASALVLQTQAPGIVVHGPSDESLVLDRVAKTARVEAGNIVITSGARVGRYESLFPYGIPIGVVESVSQRDVDLYKNVQVAPLVDFESLHEVIVLVEKRGRR